jgi:hypothetical protein
MEILDHQHHRRLGSRPSEQAKQCLEQPRLCQWLQRLAPHTTCLQLWQQTPKLSAADSHQPLQQARLRLPNQRSQHAKQRRVRQLRPAYIDATP